MKQLHIPATAPIRVLAYGPRPILDSNNTDIRYLRSLVGLATVTDVAVSMPDSHVVDAVTAAKALTRRVSARLRRRPFWASDLMPAFEVSFLERRRADWDVFYSNSAVPPNGRLGPAIRFDYIHDAHDAHESGAFNRDAVQKRMLAHHCRLVQVSTASQADAFVRIGVPADKIRVVPFFLPHLPARSVSALEKHRQREPLRIVFVGHQAWRKGLDSLIAALTAPTLTDLPFQATIVSGLTDGKIAIPKSPKILHYSALPRVKVMELMASAHILAVPSRRESFGLVYVEAMAAGAIPLMASGPQQVDIASGGCGLPLGPDPAAIADALVTLYAEPEQRLAFAEAGLAKVETNYAPHVVAAAYRAMFEHALR